MQNQKSDAAEWIVRTGHSRVPVAAVQYGVDGALYGVQYDNGLASCTDQREKDAATRTALCQGTLRPPGETARAVLSRGATWPGG